MVEKYQTKNCVEYIASSSVAISIYLKYKFSLGIEYKSSFG